MTFLKTWAAFENGLTIALVGLTLGAFTLAGCDSAGSSSTDGSDVEVGFSSTAASSSTTAASLAKTDHQLVIGGPNGDTLRIDEIRFIVSEVELEGEADSAEFETERPEFVNLPLNSTEVVSVVNGRVPSGTYTEFKFEVDDAELDDDDDEEENDLQQLRQSIADEGFDNWPTDASMVTIGTFTSANGDASTDTTYFDAEIEVEIEMDEERPFEIGTDDPDRQLTVKLRPSRWFVLSDGSPRDLSADKYQNREELFELEIENEVKEDTEFEFGSDD